MACSGLGVAFDDHRAGVCMVRASTRQDHTALRPHGHKAMRRVVAGVCRACGSAAWYALFTSAIVSYLVRRLISKFGRLISKFGLSEQ